MKKRMEASSPPQPFCTPLPSHVLLEVGPRSFGVVVEAPGPIQDWDWVSMQGLRQRQGKRTPRVDDAWEACGLLLPHRDQKHPRSRSVFVASSLMSASFASPVVPLWYDAPVPHSSFVKLPLPGRVLVDLLVPPSQDLLPFLVEVMVVAALPLPVAVHTTRRVHASSLARPCEAEARDPPLLLPFPHRHRRPRLGQASDHEKPTPPRCLCPHSSED